MTVFFSYSIFKSNTNYKTGAHSCPRLEDKKTESPKLLFFFTWERPYLTDRKSHT